MVSSIINNQNNRIKKLRDSQDERYINSKESAKIPNFFPDYKRRMDAFAEAYTKFVNEIYDIPYSEQSTETK